MYVKKKTTIKNCLQIQTESTKLDLEMKKRDVNQYGVPLFLYPGITLRAGSMMQICTPTRDQKKESVDKFVDNPTLTGVVTKNKRTRPVCLKNRH